MHLIIYLFTISLAVTEAFLSTQPPSRVRHQKRNAVFVVRVQGQSDRDNEHAPMMTRRSLLSAATLVVGASLFPRSSVARDELFRPNPLISPLLEQVRIWEQAEADEIKYGGELERGDAGNKGKTDAYPRLLVPILEIADDLSSVNTMVGDRSKWTTAQRILAQPRYQKIAFKKIFNAFGDNIYYSDPDRVNLYLGGGATPKTEQSLAYLLRNDILTNVEALQAELDYLLAHENESTEDLISYASIANSAMQEYLTFVPPNELQMAKELRKA